ncbi:unnamed protein product [Pleuronectes platessa]|uniref:Secreted protein n=1 Tax=Pleuronectes platessa TaxID=8262 RepID=A0A9N7V6P2_PLEPL|nr:unnamed protein product [Pleuronectes platessa]
MRGRDRWATWSIISILLLVARTRAQRRAPPHRLQDVSTLSRLTPTFICNYCFHPARVSNSAALPEPGAFGSDETETDETPELLTAALQSFEVVIMADNGGGGGFLPPASPLSHHSSTNSMQTPRSVYSFEM